MMKEPDAYRQENPLTFRQRFDRIDRELKAIRKLVSKVAQKYKRVAPKGENGIAKRKKRPKRPA